MKTKYATRLILLLLTFLALVGCSQLDGNTGQETATPSSPEPATLPPTTAAPVEPTESSEPLISTTEIDSLEILTLEQTAEEVPVKLRGVFPDTCSRLDDITIEQDGASFTLRVQSIQEPDGNCSQEIVPFEETVVLDVAGLDAGSYNVRANDRQVSFELGTEEEPAATAEAEPTATTAPDTGTISGLVWHDSCVNAAVVDTETPAGCVLTEENLFLADGQVGNEEGIEGVEVSIAKGGCPATEALDSIRTDEQGAFTFTNLSAGTYCVYIDMTRLQNQSTLGAGSWTAPDGGDPQFTVMLEDGQAQESFNFGWDFLNLPAEAAEQIDCSNSFEFVSDLNIPDDTAFTPGESFTKSWQLRNNGTCTWTTAYSILFVGGDQMSADESVPLEQVVEPGEELEVSIDMVAPEEPGTYRGNWQVADANGEPFGIDGFIEDAFWLQIMVTEEAGSPVPNSAAIGGVVWDDFCLNSEPGQGCQEVPEGSGVFIANGTFGAGESPLSGILIVLSENACPVDGLLPGENTVLNTTLTDENGEFRFEGLAEGTYCVYMDALNEEMIDLLIPGNWTWPTAGVGYYTWVLDPGEQKLDLDFGWDYVD